jgi:hypothetical protein
MIKETECLGLVVKEDKEVMLAAANDRKYNGGDIHRRLAYMDKCSWAAE